MTSHHQLLLFDHEIGSFTGATRTQVGKIEHAHGGTPFLDEIESMPLPIQVKFLRALQERSIERIGANKPIPVDTRVLRHRQTIPLICFAYICDPDAGAEGSAAHRQQWLDAQNETFFKRSCHAYLINEFASPPGKTFGRDVNIGEWVIRSATQP